MKSPTINILTTLSIFLFLTNCKDNPTNIRSDSKEIWPLKVGNYWIWSNTEFDSNGNKIKFYKDTIIVRNEYNQDGLKFYGICGDTSGNKRWLDACYQNRKDGLYHLTFWKILDSNKNERDSISAVLFLKYPGIAGETYICRYGIHPDTVRIESIDIDFNLEIGSFKCYKYVFNSSDRNFEERIYFYSPGIGNICTERYKQMQNSSYYLIFKSELIEYKVN